MKQESQLRQSVRRRWCWDEQVFFPDTKPRFMMEEELAGAVVRSDRVVVSKNIITSKGPGTAMDFALSLVAYLKGAEAARETSAELLYK